MYTFAWKMTVLFEQIQVVKQRKYQGRLSPEWDIDKIVFLRNGRRPNIKSVGDQEMDQTWMRIFYYVTNESIHNSWKFPHHYLPVLLEVEIAVHLQRRSISYGRVTYIKTRRLTSL